MIGGKSDHYEVFAIHIVWEVRGIIFIFKFKGPRGEAVVIGIEIVEIFHLGKD